MLDNKDLVSIPSKESEWDKTKLIKSFAEKELDNVIKKSINFAISSITGKENNFLYMENETTATQMLSVARKTYMAVYYTKKEEEIKKSYKITGLPMIDVSTPLYMKKRLMEILDFILYNEKSEVIKFIDFVREDIKKQDLLNICTNIKVGSLDYIFNQEKKKFIHLDGKRACPIQSRGAIHFNNLVDRQIIKGNKIIAGEKVYMVYLKTPNSLNNDNVLCFNDYNVVKYLFKKDYRDIIDFNIIFEKNFQQKVDTMIEVLGFTYKSRLVNTLEDW